MAAQDLVMSELAVGMRASLLAVAEAISVQPDKSPATAVRRKGPI